MLRLCAWWRGGGGLGMRSPCCTEILNLPGLGGVGDFFFLVGWVGSKAMAGGVTLKILVRGEE